MVYLKSTLLIIYLLFIKTALADDLARHPNFISTQNQPGTAISGRTKSISFLTTLDYPPFSFLGEDGKLTGFNIYLAKSICTELKIEGNCTVQAMPFDELETALLKGQGDAIISGLASTEKSREKFGFSASYLRFPARFIKMADSKVKFDFDGGLFGTRIGVLANTAQEKMLRSFFPYTKVTSYAGDSFLLADLGANKIDMVFGDAMKLAFWLGGEQSKKCCAFASANYYSDSFLGAGMSIATRVDALSLTVDIDGALQRLQSSGKINEIYLRFFPTGFY